MTKSLSLFSLFFLSACFFGSAPKQTTLHVDAVPLAHAKAPLPRTSAGQIVPPPSGGAQCSVLVLVDSAGIISNSVTRAEPGPTCPPEFAAVAEQSVLSWRFTPARNNGVAASSVQRVAVEFESMPHATTSHTVADATPARTVTRMQRPPARVAPSHRNTRR